MLIVATRGCRHGSILYGTVVLDSRLCIVMKLYRGTLAEEIEASGTP